MKIPPFSYFHDIYRAECRKHDFYRYQNDEVYVTERGLYLAIRFKETFPKRNGVTVQRLRMWVVNRSFVIKYEVTEPIYIYHHRLENVSIITNMSSQFRTRLFKKDQAKIDMANFDTLYRFNTKGTTVIY